MNKENKFKNLLKRHVIASLLTATALSCSAEEPFDTPETSADVVTCAAVYKLSAGTAIESKSKKEFAKIQKKYEKRLFNTLRSQSEEIQNMAFQMLTSQLQAERKKDPEYGAVKLLVEKQNWCGDKFPDFK